MIMTIVFMIICIINGFFAALACFCLPKLPIIGRICPFKPLTPACIGVSGGLTEDEDANIEYFPCCTSQRFWRCQSLQGMHQRSICILYSQL